EITAYRHTQLVCHVHVHMGRITYQFSCTFEYQFHMQIKVKNLVIKSCGRQFSNYRLCQNKTSILELTDGLTKSLTLFHILRGHINRTTNCTQGCCCDGGTLTR